jgi:hypothetical protein
MPRGRRSRRNPRWRRCRKPNQSRPPSLYAPYNSLRDASSSDRSSLAAEDTPGSVPTREAGLSKHVGIAAGIVLRGDSVATELLKRRRGDLGAHAVGCEDRVLAASVRAAAKRRLAASQRAGRSRTRWPGISCSSTRPVDAPVTRAIASRTTCCAGPPPDRTARHRHPATRTLRRRLLTMPGRITRSARTVTLRIPARWPW